MQRERWRDGGRVRWRDGEMERARKAGTEMHPVGDKHSEYTESYFPPELVSRLRWLGLASQISEKKKSGVRVRTSCTFCPLDART